VLQHLARSAGGIRDGRYAGGHGFEQHQRLVFIVARQEQQVCAAHLALDLARGQLPEQLHAGQRCRALGHALGVDRVHVQAAEHPPLVVVDLAAAEQDLGDVQKALARRDRTHRDQAARSLSRPRRCTPASVQARLGEHQPCAAARDGGGVVVSRDHHDAEPRERLELERVGPIGRRLRRLCGEDERRKGMQHDTHALAARGQTQEGLGVLRSEPDAVQEQRLLG
jgi:hypothetical protein